MCRKLFSFICLVVVWHFAMVGATFAGAIIYVDADRPSGDGSSWSNAYKHLQDALHKPPTSGDQIWVAGGTYKPDEGGGQTPGDRAATFQLKNGVAIYGGFAGNETTLQQRNWATHKTILSGDIGTPGGSSDNSKHVVTGSGTNPTAVLDGFTITAGYADGGNPDNKGAGMFNSSGSPKVTNCTFRNNSAADWGGGMLNIYDSNPMLNNCTFVGNIGSYGGGMCNERGASPTLINCTFISNSAYSGGAIGNYQNTAKFTNCTFRDNSADNWGGGIYINEGSPTLTNCTLSGNSAAQGGGMYNINCSPVLTNCVLWGNRCGASIDENTQIRHQGSHAEVVSYSCIQGLNVYAGNNNIGDDPRLQDADGSDDVVGTEDDDLRLSACSPCIDAGNNDAVPSDTADLDGDSDTTEPTPLDLDGNPRFVDDPVPDTGNGTPPIVDMGAYESSLVSFICAWNPNPANGAKCVESPVILSWSPGCGAAKHDVYFGVDFDAVNNATIMSPEYKSRQDPNSYYPVGLLPSQDCPTYYWRIDEVNGINIWKGDVWSFTTKGNDCCHCIDPPEGMVAWWPLDETTGNVSEELVKNNDGTWMGSPTPVTGKVAGALDFNGVTDYVEVPDDAFLDFGTGDLSIDAWVKTSDASDIKSILDKRSGFTSPRGYCLYLNSGILTFQLVDGTLANYYSSLFVADGNWHHVAATLNRDDPDGLKLYVDGVSQTFNPMARPGSLTNDGNLLIGAFCYISSNRFDGSIDEVELFNRALGANEIQAIFEAGSDGKCKCKPAPAYKDDIKWSQPPERNYLGCINGWDEVSIYYNEPIIADDWRCRDNKPIKGIHWWGSFKGWTEPNQVPPAEMPDAFHIGIWTDVPDPDPNDPNNFSHPGKLIWEKRCESFVWSYAGCDLDPRGEGALDACFLFDQLLSQDKWFYQDPNGSTGTVYWLSIAAIYSDDDMAPVPYVLIDDFESYADSAGLLATWIDGFVNGTGSSSALETTITHGGAQAMKVDYDNANPPYYSEVRRTYPVPQNWTVGGVKKFGLWFRGQAGNAVEKMYVALEDGAGICTTVYHQNPNVVTNGYWQFWCIDLQEFSGLNLTHVKKVYIGFGDKHAPAPNGSGTVYFDDIGLYQECRCEPKYAWGWKTRPHFYNDDAVRITSLGGQWPPVIGSVWAGGEPIEYPAGTSWDVAFVLTTNREYQPMKWWWPPQADSRADLYEDGKIDFKDMAIMAGNWLTEGEIWPEYDMP